jgi:hypothetical protein
MIFPRDGAGGFFSPSNVLSASLFKEGLICGSAPESLGRSRTGFVFASGC